MHAIDDLKALTSEAERLRDVLREIVELAERLPDRESMHHLAREADDFARDMRDGCDALREAAELTPE